MRLAQLDITEFDDASLRALCFSKNTPEIDEACCVYRGRLFKLKRIVDPVIKNLVPKVESKYLIMVNVLNLKREADRNLDQQAKRNFVEATIKNEIQRFRIALAHTPNEWFPINCPNITLKNPINHDATFNLETLTSEQIQTLLDGKLITVTAKGDDSSEIKFLIKTVAASHAM